MLQQIYDWAPMALPVFPPRKRSTGRRASGTRQRETLIGRGLDSAALATFVLLVVCGLSGCHRKVQHAPPDTYPVTGKVVVSKGEIPVGARIEFAPSDPEAVAEGSIAADGSFSLRTLFHEQWLPGATEGPHRVMVRPSGAYTLVVKESYTIEPKENHFIVKLDSPPVPRGQRDHFGH